MVSRKIKFLREKSLLTQVEFASELGVSESTINRWETGKAFPNISAMKNIKNFCRKNNFPYEQIENDWLIRNN